MKQRGWLIGSLGFGTMLAGVMAGAFATGIEQHTTSVSLDTIGPFASVAWRLSEHDHRCELSAS